MTRRKFDYHFRFNFEDHHLEFSNLIQDRVIGTKDEAANVSISNFQGKMHCSGLLLCFLPLHFLSALVSFDMEGILMIMEG